MYESVFISAVIFPSAAAVLIFAMKYLSIIRQAKVRFDENNSYREIALKVASAQADTVAELSSVSATLIDIQFRLTALEKTLQDIE